jgi:hypothetical protein
MLNLIQHLTKSITYETLKRVQGDRLGLFTRPSKMKIQLIILPLRRGRIEVGVDRVVNPPPLYPVRYGCLFRPVIQEIFYLTG